MVVLTCAERSSLKLLGYDTSVLKLNFWRIAVHSRIFNLIPVPSRTISPTPTRAPASLGTSVFRSSLQDEIAFLFQNTADVMQSWHLAGSDFWRKQYNLHDAISRSTAQVYTRSWTAIFISSDNPRVQRRQPGVDLSRLKVLPDLTDVVAFDTVAYGKKRDLVDESFDSLAHSWDEFMVSSSDFLDSSSAHNVFDKMSMRSFSANGASIQLGNVNLLLGGCIFDPGGVSFALRIGDFVYPMRNEFMIGEISELAEIAHRSCPISAPEVDHNALGDGIIFSQGVKRVDLALASGQFYDGAGFNYIKESFETGTLHLIGLLSDGGVHSRLDQVPLLLKGAAERGAKKIRVHFLTDVVSVVDFAAMGGDFLIFIPGIVFYHDLNLEESVSLSITQSGRSQGVHSCTVCKEFRWAMLEQIRLLLSCDCLRKTMSSSVDDFVKGTAQYLKLFVCVDEYEKHFRTWGILDAQQVLDGMSSVQIREQLGPNHASLEVFCHGNWNFDPGGVFDCATVGNWIAVFNEMLESEIVLSNFAVALGITDCRLFARQNSITLRVTEVVLGIASWWNCCPLIFLEWLLSFKPWRMLPTIASSFWCMLGGTNFLPHKFAPGERTRLRNFAAAAHYSSDLRVVGYVKALVQLSIQGFGAFATDTNFPFDPGDLYVCMTLVDDFCAVRNSVEGMGRLIMENFCHIAVLLKLLRAGNSVQLICARCFASTTAAESVDTVLDKRVGDTIGCFNYCSYSCYFARFITASWGRMISLLHLFPIFALRTSRFSTGE